MKYSLPFFLRDSNSLSLVLLSLMHPDSEAHISRLVHRDISSGTLTVLVVMPIVAVGLLAGAIFVIILRRRKRKRLHGNSPTASAIRNSLEEDLESYRRERERMGDVMGMGAGVSQEDLEHQLRDAAAGIGSARDSIISMTTASGPNSRSASRHRRSDIDGWYAPPAVPHSPRRSLRPNSLEPPNANADGAGRRRGRGPPGSRVSRGPSCPGSRPVSGLRNSIRQVDEDEAREEKMESGGMKIEQIDEGDTGAEKALRGFYEPEPKTMSLTTKDPTYR